MTASENNITFGWEKNGQLDKIMTETSDSGLR